MCRAIEIAYYIITKCTNKNDPISNLQLQSILYHIQKNYLIRWNRTAFEDEFEAWQFGPVVLDVYQHFCGFGAMNINAIFDDFYTTDFDHDVINSFIKSSSKYTNYVTLKEENSWKIVYNNGKGLYHIISTELIKNK